jgi:hypothetical protein
MNFLGKKACGVERITFVAYLAKEPTAGCHVAVGTEFFYERA